MDSPERIDTNALLAEAGYVHRLARVLVRRADLADDVAQDVALAALQHRAAPGHLRGWLAAVTRRLAGRARRAETARAWHEAAAAPPPERDEGAAATGRLRLHQQLTAALLALPEPYRTAVTLRFVDELPPRAIAARLHTSSDVVRQRVHRGLALLRERLDAEFGERDRWVRAFVAAGCSAPAGPWLLLTGIAMSKLALGVAAAAVAVAAGWLWWHAAPAPAAPATAVVAQAPAPAAANVDAAAAPAPDGAAPVAREAVAPAPPVDARCDVVVVDADGRPVAGAVVTWWRQGAATVTERETDSGGACTFAGAEGPSELLVMAPGRFPWHRTLVDARGAHRCELPAGAWIMGTLLVDGVPAPGWDLRLEGPCPLPPLPAAIADEVRFRPCEPFRTGRDGAFRFDGLPPDWRGSLKLPQALWLSAEHGEKAAAEQLAVTAGDRVVLHATQLPSLVGRVVWQHDSSPVALADITANGVFDDEGGTPLFGYRADRRGAFVIGFHSGVDAQRRRWLEAERRPALRRLQLRVESRDGAATTKVELSGEQLRSRREVVIELTAPAITHFRVVDPDERPLANARLAAGGISDPADANGCGTFAGAPADVKLVGAPGHRIGPTTAARGSGRTADDPLVFVLEPANRVRIVVRGRDPATLAGRTLRLRSEVAAFAGGRQHSQLDELLGSAERDGSANGSRQPDGSTRWHTFTSDAPLDANGATELTSLEPGVSCVVAVLGDLDNHLGEATFVAPAAGEALTVAIDVGPAAPPFVVAVRDEAGAPVERAQVTIKRPQTKRSRGRYTDATGTCTVVDPGPGAVDVRIEAPGFVQVATTTTTDVTPLQVVLQRGREVEVRVVDEYGAPVAVRAYPNGTPCREESVGPGRNRVRDLPAGIVTFFCKVGTHAFTLAHDTANPIAELRVPRPGTVRFTAPGGWPEVPETGSRTLRIVHVDGAGEPLNSWLPETDSVASGILVPGVYRAQLLLTRRDGEQRVETPLGAPVEFTIVAGTEQVVPLL